MMNRWLPVIDKNGTVKLDPLIFNDDMADPQPVYLAADVLQLLEAIKSALTCIGEGPGALVKIQRAYDLANGPLVTR